MTNFEKITQSEENLSKWIAEKCPDCGVCDANGDKCKSHDNCQESILEWLKEEISS